MTTAAKTERIHLRATAREQELLRMAAADDHRSLSDFILHNSLLAAERKLADQREFVLPPEEYEEFSRALDEPYETPRLDAFLRSDPGFDRPLTDK